MDRPASLLVASILAGLGCVTPYQPSGFSGGYSEVLIAPRTYEVTFKGNGLTSEDRVYRLALRRAAELTAKSGLYGFFVRTEEASVGASLVPTFSGEPEVVYKPRSHITITMVSADEAAKLPPDVLVYEASRLLAQGY